MGFILIKMSFVLPKTPKKVIVIGDLHTDLDIFKEILIKNNIINYLDEWCGKDTWVICMGDTFDGCRPDIVNYDKDYLNNPMEMKLFNFILNLNMKATLEGGSCISLMGNHDLFLFDKRNRSYCKNVDYKSYPIKREELFKPGINMSMIMANTRPLILVLGKYLFVHGGLTKNVINKEGTLYDKITSLNDELSKWLISGKNEPYWLYTHNNPTMNRTFSQGGTQEEFDNLLDMLPGIEKVIVGHTTFQKISSRFNGKLILTDIGLSRCFNKNLYHKWQILEIYNDNTYIVSMDYNNNLKFTNI